MKMTSHLIKIHRTQLKRIEKEKALEDITTLPRRRRIATHHRAPKDTFSVVADLAVEFGHQLASVRVVHHGLVGEALGAVCNTHLLPEGARAGQRQRPWVTCRQRRYQSQVRC